jgi:hypothetical protein
MYDTTSADATVSSLNTIVQEAMEQAIPRDYTRKSKFTQWYFWFFKVLH